MSLPIVGAHFRLQERDGQRWPCTPAKALLSALPTKTPLYVIPEPTNPFDSYALAVILLSSDIPHSLSEYLNTAVAGAGWTAEEVYKQPEHHLGYIPAKIAATMTLPEEGVKGELSFDLSGKPEVRLPKED